MATAAPAPIEVVSEREAARLAKHYHELDEKRKALESQARNIGKEQTAIERKLWAYVVATSPKDRVVALSKFVLSIVGNVSARYISWKSLFGEKVGEAAVAELEANPPSRDVLKIERKAA